MIRGQDYSSGTVATAGLYRVAPAVASAYRRSTVRGGDLLLSIVGYVGQAAEVPAELTGANLTQTTARISVRDDEHARFFLHLFRSPPFQDEVRKYTKGSAQPGLNLADVEKLRISVPPLPEQRRIAEVLDTVDDAIRRTEQIVAKLEQMKQGLLHDLLTRGIDENGELRDPNAHPDVFAETPAGVIPCSWKSLRFRDCMVDTPRNGLYKSQDDIGDGALLIGQTAFTEGRDIDPALARRARVTRQEIEVYGLRPGDLLLSRVYATVSGVGRPVLVGDLGEDAVYESNLLRVRIREDVVSPSWVFQWLQHDSYRRLVRAGVNSSNQSSINQSFLNGVPIAVPPHEEQDHVLSVISDLSTRAAAEGTSLAKLCDLKSALMSDLLTGTVRFPEFLEAAG